MTAKSFNRSLLGDEEDAWRIRATTGSAQGGGVKTARIGARLDARMKRAPTRRGERQTKDAAPEGHAADPRQRAIVKVHYYVHAGGGGAALRAHGGYIEREGARLAPEVDAHADYLSREGSHGFYDRDGASPGRERLAAWSKEDRRHFRIVLSPENGEALGDLAGYTREVMARAEAALGRSLQWVAVNHWDTDNPHAHIVLRGRDGAGRPLSLPDQFIKHGFREIARDVATERLGPRSPDEARRARDREIRAHRLTGLDRRIAEHADRARRVCTAALGRNGGDPEAAAAMKARLVELARLGLAEEAPRGRFTLSPDWQARLAALEAHIYIRRSRFAAERARRAAPGRAAHADPSRNAGEFERVADAVSRQAGKPLRALGERAQRWTVRGEIEVSGMAHLALERHDRVLLAPRPAGLDVGVGDKVLASMKHGVAHMVRAPGIER